MFSTLLSVPANVFLVAAVVAEWFPSAFFFTVAAVTVLFVELIKTLFLATHQTRAMFEFGASLALLLLLSLYIQSRNSWGANNLTVCALIQFFDTVGGFIGTFLLARRDFGA
ncbi:MAG: hypothetical protein ACU837_05635 [Gammaproteobacteria bacterium]